MDMKYLLNILNKLIKYYLFNNNYLINKLI